MLCRAEYSLSGWQSKMRNKSRKKLYGAILDPLLLQLSSDTHHTCIHHTHIHHSHSHSHRMGLWQRTLQNLHPGMSDTPKPQHSSAKVHADKQKKEAAKEAATVKTKAARARVEQIHGEMHMEFEQVKSNPAGMLVKGSKKAGGTGRKGKDSAAANTRGSKPKISKVAEPLVEAIKSVADDDSISIKC